MVSYHRVQYQKKLDFFEKWLTFDQKKFYAIPFLKLVFLVSIYPQFLENKKTKKEKKVDFRSILAVFISPSMLI